MTALTFLLALGAVLAPGEAPSAFRHGEAVRAEPVGLARSREASPYRLRYYEPFRESEVGPNPVEGPWPRAPLPACGREAHHPDPGRAPTQKGAAGDRNAHSPCPADSYSPIGPAPYGNIPPRAVPLR